MALKFIILAAFVAVTNAGVLTPLATAIVDAEYDPNPHYTFGYDVQDPFTGDNKNQIESRSGDVVHGSYSLNDPDGTRRVVDYTADPINGFNAVVKKTPIVQALMPAPVLSNDLDRKHFKSQFKNIVPNYVNPLTYSLQYSPFVYSYPTVYTSPYFTHYY